MILGFTHLGSQGDYHPNYSTLRIERDKVVNSDKLAANSIGCCMTCCDLPRVHCCCPLYHASYSPGCTCRRIPVELFQVNRQMHQEAVEIFYSSVSLEFYQDFDLTTRFLSRLPCGALKLIQNLKFCFRPTNFSNWTAWGFDAQWGELISLIHENSEL